MDATEDSQKENLFDLKREATEVKESPTWLKDKMTFKCEYCPKEFRYSVQYERHKRLHTGEKPSKCNQCDKSFSSRSNLIAHQRVHTSARPFVCTQCDKNF